MSQKILVTGSEGFLGKRVVKVLDSAGHHVVPFDLSLGHDIRDESQLRQGLSGCDACIHLAAVSDLYIASDDPDACFHINVGGTENVAKTCLSEQVHLIYASTCCVYGNNGSELSSESSLVSPTELYAETKLQGEQRIMEIGCNHIILRLATFYGPGMRESLAIHRFISLMLQGREITIHGDGTQTRCYTHVDDVASGILVALKQGLHLTGKIINIADDKPYSVNDLVDIIESRLGIVADRRYTEDRPGQIKSSVIDNTLLRSLGWSASYDFPRGIAECIDEISK